MACINANSDWALVGHDATVNSAMPAVDRFTADDMNQVNEEVRRKSNQQIASEASKQEQAQRSVQEYRETEVNIEARRRVAQVTADKAVAKEHQNQLQAPRRPSVELAASLDEVHDAVRRKSNQKIAMKASKEEQEQRVVQEYRAAEVNVEARRRVAQQTADKAMAEEQAQRSVQEYCAAEVNVEARRRVAQQTADKAMAEEQAQRSVQEYRETEVNIEARRRVAQVTADKAVECEKKEQLLKPRRPSAEFAANMNCLRTDLVRSG